MKHNWHDVILPEYEIRKTYAQKTAFIEMLGRNISGISLDVHGKTRNIVIGDPETADVVFTAHYDTCPVLPFPNFITPRNVPIYVAYQLVLSAAIVAPAFIIGHAAERLSETLGRETSWLIGYLTTMGLLFGEMGLMLAGPANKHTANDNTSGVITVLTLAETLNPERNAFILFDGEEMGLIGSSAYAKSHPDVKKNKLIVNLDCVSDGDTLLFICSDKAVDYRNRLAVCTADVFSKYGKKPLVVDKRGTVYPSDQILFKRSIAVCALKESKIGLYMDRIHTKNDTVFDKNNISALVELFSAADTNE